MRKGKKEREGKDGGREEGREGKGKGKREVNLRKEKNKIAMGWILLPQSLYIEILTPSAQNVAIFRDRACKEVIKLNGIVRVGGP